MGKTSKMIIAILVLWIISWPVYGGAAEESSCVTCHTDAQTMKSLCKAPPSPGGEGEG